MTFKKATAVLFVESAEPCIQFWVERFGFTKIMDVPEGDRIGFAILQKDGVELMYQTYASAEKDMAAIAGAVRKGPSFLFIEVDDLAAAIAATGKDDIAMPERTTFYGSREIGVRDPAGHHFTFAQF